MHGKGHTWYFSYVEFAGESESVIRMNKLPVVIELEQEMCPASVTIGHKMTKMQKQV
jgi:hypothetical protein